MDDSQDLLEDDHNWLDALDWSTAFYKNSNTAPEEDDPLNLFGFPESPIPEACIEYSFFDEALWHRKQSPSSVPTRPSRDSIEPPIMTREQILERAVPLKVYDTSI